MRWSSGLDEFIKDSDDYGLFILESDIGGDDWLGDHGHIKEFDQVLATEGTNFIHLPYAGKMRKVPNFNKQIIDFFKGQGVDISLGTGHWIYTIEGRYGGTSEANRNDKMKNLELLYMKHINLSQGKLYLGYRMIGEVWHPHIDPNDAVKYYLPGTMLIGEYWRDAIHNYYNWRVAFRGVW